MTDRVAVVVLSWNGRDDTLACLASLARATYPALDVIVVDNASTDGSPQAVAGHHPTVRLLRLGENRGFAGGVNTGIDAALEAGADHVMLINNDATVAPDFLEPLVEAVSSPTVGAACSQILEADDPPRIWYAGASYDPRKGYQGRHTGFGEPPIPAGRSPYSTDRACGGAMLVPRRALEVVGTFDERLFAYAEDVDWSLRARSAGLEILVVPASVVRHRVSAATGGASSPTSIYYALRNGLIVAERHAPLGSPGRFRRRFLAAAAFTAQALRSDRRADGLRAVVQALRDARAGRVGPRV